MNILSGIKNFIKDSLGVNGTKKVKSSTPVKAVSKPNSVVETKNTQKNEDCITITNKDAKNAQKQTQPQRTVGQIRQSIENKCRANNLDFAKLKKRFGHITERFQARFEELPEEKQVRILLVVEHEIDRIIKLQKKHGKSVQTDNTEIVIESAKTKVEAEEAGINEKQLELKAGDINEELGKNFKNADVKERRKRMDEYAKAQYKEFEANLQKEIAKIPEKDRAAYIKQKREEYRLTMRARFNDIVATQDSETGLNAIAMLPADDMTEGLRIVKRTRVNKAEKTRISDKADWDFTEGVLKTQYERGEKASTNTIQEYTTEVVADKSATAVQQYQTRYMERRQAFENGENVPEYLNQDFFTASAKGIGQGALNNTNMTTDEKAEFISQWKEDAQKFEDRDVVTKDVNESLAKKPEYKELAEKVRVIDEKKAVEQVAQKNTEKDTIKTETTTVNISTPENQTVTQVSQKSEPQVIRHQNDTNTKPAKQVTSNTVTNPLTQNNQEIAKDIQTLGVDEAIKTYGHETVIATVLNNQNLKHMRPTLAPIIKSYDLQSLEKLASDCSTSSFLYICSIVNKEYVAELRDKRPDLCYSARKIVEKNIEVQNA